MFTITATCDHGHGCASFIAVPLECLNRWSNSWRQVRPENRRSKDLWKPADPKAAKADAGKGANPFPGRSWWRKERFPKNGLSHWF